MNISQGLAFHVHHDTLVEYCYNYNERIINIKNSKPKDEQELRLRLFKLIPEDRLPGKDSLEWEAYCKARETWEPYVETWEARAKTWRAYFEKYDVEFQALHKELCPNCPWDGVTIFPEKAH